MSRRLRLLLVIVIVMIVAGTGLFVYHATTKSNANLRAANRDAASSASLKTTPKTVSHSKDPLASDYPVAKWVLAAYQSYVASLKAGNADGVKGALVAMKPYLSSALYQKISADYAKQTDGGQDEIICAQAFPDNLTAALDETDPGRSVVTVGETFGQTTYDTSVVVSDSPELITSIDCSDN